MDKLLIFIIGYASISLVACSTERLPGIYRIDVQQGNIITQDMLDKLKLGMSKQQVTFVLGTPLVVDTFLPDRWYYVYSFKSGKKQREQRTITVWFKDDKLLRVSGDVKIGAYQKPKSEESEQVTSVIVPPRPESTGPFSGLMNKLGLGHNSKDTPPDTKSSKEGTEISSQPAKEGESDKTPPP
ncbi:SmpA/OmlA domain-containing protein [Candidatus Nitrosoglobus terrae]|uniref:Outer membrane protein assembly factor BamE n=1 Tax=Candidatus Nitrosoglobus terrae TaxID=1630141 RepID=A0A1Q2SNU4_9GAMM|nr:outer membrane protein assembly factor BamE [Candidatus Nitrosoglobus terrae]BAW80800.1 SmpA/OmlA domain-containing protein [Candidatus Nitrosoglobus terrae]